MIKQFPTAQWAWIIQNGLLESIEEEKEHAEEMKKKCLLLYPEIMV